MCYGCWEEMGKPAISTAKVHAAVPLIRRVYDLNCVGGNLHIVLDDWNLQDEHVQWCSEQINAGGFPFKDDPDLLAAERICCDALLAMTERERASALAFYDGFFP